VLLLSYLDKICLILTGEPGRALAYLYSEAGLYKGAGAVSLSQSTALHSTSNTCVCVKGGRESATATQVEK
jgi:hypothetical protein